MTTRLNDNRAVLAMTAEEADALFQQIAETEIAAAAEAAQYEKELAAVKSRAADAQAQHAAILRPLRDRLTAYINARPERFAKPRMRKTEWGSYGLRSVTNVEIVDEMAAMISVKAQGIPAVVMTEKLDKKALEAAISDGKAISGVEIRTGEIAKYIVTKALLDNARNKN